TAAAPTQAALMAALDDDRKAPNTGGSMTDCEHIKAPEPKADTPPAPEATPEAVGDDIEGKGVKWGALTGAVLVLVLLVGGVVTWPQWKDQVMPARVAAPQSATILAPNGGGEVEVLRADLDQTRERLRQLEARLAERAAAPVGGADLGPVENRLGQVEQSLRTLQAQPQVPARLADDVAALGKQVGDLAKTSADAAAVLRLADRVEKVEAEMRDLQARRSSATALLLAVGQLREAVNNAMPYDAELRAVRVLAPEGGDTALALDALKARAAAGIPNRLVLAQRFEALAPELVRAETLPSQRSWWRDTLHRLSTLVTLRREDGDAAGNSAAAIVARAEQRLEQGDLAAAAAEIEQLQGGAAEAARPWLEDARARAAADKSLSELTAHVVASFGPRQ
ncbi:MAG TPA: mitofilin family membrane protein, partial [Candidatus Omnitrophota bacterium]|nr:mitofilin family membrane protein [Candidatus Omnitrophota bacterium]